MVAKLPIQGINIHLLHLLRNTALVKLWEQGNWNFYHRIIYQACCRYFGNTSPGNDCSSINGDGPPDLLIGPMWSRKKWEVLNGIEAELKAGIRGKENIGVDRLSLIKIKTFSYDDQLGFIRKGFFSKKLLLFLNFVMLAHQ